MADLPLDVGIEYRFCAKTWQYAPESWCFVSLPKAMSGEIREDFRSLEEGWGRMKVAAKVGSSEWESAIWFDTKHETYLLPLKAEIRKKEKIQIDQDVEVTIWIR